MMMIQTPPPLKLLRGECIETIEGGRDQKMSWLSGCASTAFVIVGMPVCGQPNCMQQIVNTARRPLLIRTNLDMICSSYRGRMSCKSRRVGRRRSGWDEGSEGGRVSKVESISSYAMQ